MDQINNSNILQKGKHKKKEYKKSFFWTGGGIYVISLNFYP